LEVLFFFMGGMGSNGVVWILT